MFIMYKQPYDIHKSYKASTEDGRVLDLSIQLKGYRNVFSPTTFEGTINTNNTNYHTIKVNVKRNFFQKLKSKINGAVTDPIVLLNEKDLREKQDMIVILWNDKHFSEMYFTLTKSGDFFFAPANSSLEVEHVKDSMSKQLQ